LSEDGGSCEAANRHGLLDAGRGGDRLPADEAVGHQWMIATCWMGVVIWCAYVFNMTVYADVRYAGVVFPVIGWWLYDIFYITPFLAIPHLHTANREIFSD
jgi:hypothetical protein